MGYKKLQIKQLSKSGELLKVVNCPAGQITVLRANAPIELTGYQRAIAGIPGPERFSINLDADPFNHTEHNLIGFGEDNLSASISVIEYLFKRGLSEGSAWSLLVSYGLEEKKDTPLSLLSDCERRRLSIVAAIHQPDKVLIMNNPFEPISSAWRARIADLISHFARTHNAIVLITSLNYRPEQWIDNEQINRVQVGDNLQKTIGFGSVQGSANNILQEVRRMLAEDKPAGGEQQLGLEVEQSVPDLFNQQVRPGRAIRRNDSRSEEISISSQEKTRIPQDKPFSPLFKLISESLHQPAAKVIVILALCVVISGVVFLKKEAGPTGHNETVELAVKTDLDRPVEQPPSTKEKKGPAKKEKSAIEQRILVDQAGRDQKRIDPSEPQTVPIPVKVTSPTAQPRSNPAAQKKSTAAPPMVKSNYLLDQYPVQIKQAIVQAFEETDVTAGITRRAAVSPPSGKNKENNAKLTDGLISALKAADGTGDKLPDRSDYRRPAPEPFGDSQNSMSMEERRNLMREKFRQAIERAAAMKR